MIKKLITITALLLTLSAPAVLAASSSTNDKIFSACDQAPNSSVCQDQKNQSKNPTTDPVAHTIHVVANILSLITGVVAVIMILASSLTYVTSEGNSEAVTGARRRIIYAVVGLTIVSIAWALTTFLTDRLITT